MHAAADPYAAPLAIAPTATAPPLTHAALHWFDPQACRTWPVTVGRESLALSIKGGDLMSREHAHALSGIANQGGVGGLAGCVPRLILNVIFPASSSIPDAASKEYWARKDAFVRQAQLLAFNSALAIWCKRRSELKRRAGK